MPAMADSWIRCSDFKRCYTNYLCTRCGINAYDPAVSPVQHVCKPCIDRSYDWCKCPGCGTGPDHHAGLAEAGPWCRNFGSHHPKDRGFCPLCARRWHCQDCGCAVRSASSCPTSATCPGCALHGQRRAHKRSCGCDYESCTIHPGRACTMSARTDNVPRNEGCFEEDLELYSRFCVSCAHYWSGKRTAHPKESLCRCVGCRACKPRPRPLAGLQDVLPKETLHLNYMTDRRPR